MIGTLAGATDNQPKHVRAAPRKNHRMSVIATMVDDPQKMA
jgi:hypothetical protein